MCDENATSRVQREAMMEMLGIRKTKGMVGRGTRPIQPRDQAWGFFRPTTYFDYACWPTVACFSRRDGDEP